MISSKNNIIRIIALGGNQIAPLGIEMNPGINEQLMQTRKTAGILADIFKKTPDCQYVLTHGNGPQVGNIQLAFEIASRQGFVYPINLPVAGAMSQGQIGYMLQSEMQKAFSEKGLKKNTATVITQVLVSKEDPGFDNHTKYIGQGYTAAYLMKTMEIKDKREIIRGKPEFIVDMEDQTKVFRLYEGSPELGIYREVVASPLPKEIIEIDIIADLIESGVVPIAVGGGGIPVIKEGEGYLGVDAVIDKDFASALLASKLKKRYPEKEVELIILTGSDGVYLDFGKTTQSLLQTLDIDAAKKLMDLGHFPPGSMGPKIQAGIFALKNKVDKVFITEPEHLEETLDEKAGTRMCL